ncbi:hypothetical protein TWF569_005828 [Orbilia oligospora]|nr:hypothetical protein TWF569_005828 [Orbilia oligospora]
MALGMSYDLVPSSGQGQGIFRRIWQACADRAIPSDFSRQPDLPEIQHDGIESPRATDSEGQSHIASSPKSFKCGDCDYTSKHKGTLERHVGTKHNATRQLHLCPVPSCKRSRKGFSRPDNLARHIKQVHPEEKHQTDGIAYIGNHNQYLLSSNPDSSSEASSTQESSPGGSTATSFSETEDGWCSITDGSWEVSASIEEVGFQQEGGWEDLGGPNAYVVKQPLNRISISDLRGLLQLAGEDALIQLPDEPSPRKGDDIRKSIKEALNAKEDARSFVTLTSQLPTCTGSPASSYTLPSNTPHQAFELLDQKIRETMEPSKDKRINQHRVLHLYDKFLEEANNAYLKLIDATEDPINMRSPALKDFISSLINVENIITTGSAALSDFLDRKVPMDLKSIYCMLHVSYSMSHSTTLSHSPQITDTQFSESAATWKEWLPVVSDSGVREQDVFEELLEIMWSEMKGGLELMENLTEWIENLNREQVMIEEETNPDLPTTGVFQDGDPLYPGVSDPLFPDLAENYQDIDYLPPNSTIINVPMPQELRPCCDPHLFSPPVSLEPPPWESLSASLVITGASSFLQELESSGILFLDRFGILETLFASRVCDDKKDLSQSAGRLDHILPDVQERQKVVKSMQRALDHPIYPRASSIVSKVSNLFLKGYLAGLEDLEECAIFFLRILCKPSHSVLNFFSAIVAHFTDYYHSQLPAKVKCPHDRYKNACYMSSRFKEAEGFVRSARRSGSTPTSSPISGATSPNLPDPQAPTCPRQRDHNQTGVDERIKIPGKISNLTTETIQGGHKRKFRFKVETGNPASRKRFKTKHYPNLHSI